MANIQTQPVLNWRWYQPASDIFPLLAASLCIALATLLFWLFPLDFLVQDFFFVADAENHWPSADLGFWRFLYQASWIVAGLFAIVGVALGIAGSRIKRLQYWGNRGWCLLLVIILGAGLVANVILKDHYGRYRPRQIDHYAGNYVYQPPLLPGERGVGKSFPCGHATAGFAFYIFYFFWRRRRRNLAWLTLAMATALGLTFGLGRAAAGAHFLSDTLWAGYFMFATSWLVYYPIMHMPRHEQGLAEGHSAPPMPLKNKLAITAGIIAVIVGALMAKPQHEDIHLAPTRPEMAEIKRIRLHFDDATLRLIEDTTVQTFSLDLKTRGFGLPSNRLLARTTEQEGVWQFSYQHQGYFSETGTEVDIRVHPRYLPYFDIQLDAGKLFVAGNIHQSAIKFSGQGQWISQ